MTIILNGTTGITTPTVNSSGDLTIADKIVHSGDTDTAIRFPAADTVAVETEGAERLRVDSAGNVGIGVTSPTRRLTVSASAGSSVLAIQDENTGNTSTDGFQLQLASNGDMYLWNYENSITAFGTSNTERARIDVSGNLLVGTTSGGSGRIVSVGRADGTIYTFDSNQSPFGSGAIGHIRFSNSNGTVGTITTNGSSTAYNTFSDYRLKENVAPMQNALDKIAQLNPVTYTWKADGSSGQGFIAHELQDVVPDCVTGEKDAVDKDGNPQYQGVDTSFLVATLVKAIQELTARVATLEAAQ